MKLVIDVGNTRLKWAEWNAPDLSPLQSTVHLDRPWESLFDEQWPANRSHPVEVWVSNVGGVEFEAALRLWGASHWACPLYFVRSEARAAGVVNAYSSPERLGSDRWANLVGAYALGLAPNLIVSAGTAITADWIDGDGLHRGGFITPGIHLMQRALKDNTKIERIDAPNDLRWVPAQDTESAIKRGTLYSVVAWIEYLAASTEQRLNTKIVPVLTGGDAELLAERLKIAVDVKPELTLLGLVRLAEKQL